MISETLEKILNQVMADLMVLHIKLHNLHWFVRGKEFYKLHELFESFYDEAAARMDDVAELMLMSMMTPIASMREALDKTQVEECMSERIDGRRALTEAIMDMQYMQQLCEEAAQIAIASKDDGAEALMLDMKMFYKKQIWMLYSTMENDEE